MTGATKRGCRNGSGGGDGLRRSRSAVAVLCLVALLWGTASTAAGAEGLSTENAESARPSAGATALVGTRSTAPRWKWPLAAVTVTKAYAAPATPYASGHRGIDLAAPTGTVVTAPADAVVWFSGIVVDRPVLTLDHGGGVLSSYEPVRSPLAAGDAVHAGDPLGVVAEGGHCGGTCLHIGVRVDGEYVSPLLFFSTVPRAVLLPVRRPSLG